MASTVLTIARNERSARLGQEAAEHEIDVELQSAQFDYVAGCDIHTAIQIEANCRRCTHVLVETEPAHLRQGWFAKGQLDPSQLSRSLTFLILPKSGSLLEREPSDAATDGNSLHSTILRR
jgi:hypothetical protein